MTDGLVAWLRAQLDEDERVADAAAGHDVEALVSDEAHAHLERWGTARVLAEVAAKRGLITQALRWMALRDGEWGCCHDPSEIEAGTCPGEKPGEDRSLRLLASVYAGRPGWRSEWAPDEEATP